MVEQRGQFPFRLKGSVWFGSIALVLILLAIAVRLEAQFLRQQLAVREIRQAGGYVEIEPAGPVWIRSWTGDECWKQFGTVRSVRLPFSEEIDVRLRNFDAFHPTPTLYLTDAPPIHQYVCKGPLRDALATISKCRSLVFACDDFQQTPLHFATGYNELPLPESLELIRLLIRKGAAVNAKTRYAYTPLHLANDPQVVQLLLEHGASLTMTNAFGETPLDVAAERYARSLFGTVYRVDGAEPWRCAQLLRGAGAECDLLSAVFLDDPDRVRQLIKQPLIDREHSNSRNFWAMNKAAWCGRAAILKILVENGADPNYCYSQGPPSSIAIKHPHVLELLFHAGADPNVKVDVQTPGRDCAIEDQGWSLLHVAAKEGALESLRVLLNWGIPADVRNAAGATPLDIARKVQQDRESVCDPAAVAETIEALLDVVAR